jgi:hypothetical protein
MSAILLWPAKFLGWAVTGAALGIGWKVGTLIYDKVEKALSELETGCPQLESKAADEKQAARESQG